MIAILAKHERDFQELNLRPKNNFKRIHSINDIRGYEFTGIIFTYRWYELEALREAYEHLIIRNPELKL